MLKLCESAQFFLVYVVLVDPAGDFGTYNPSWRGFAGTGSNWE